MSLKKLFMMDCEYFLDRLEERHGESFTRPTPADVIISNRNRVYLSNSDLNVTSRLVGEIHIASSDVKNSRKRREIAAHSVAVWMGAKLFAKRDKLDVFRGYNDKQRRNLGAHMLADAGLAMWTPVKRAREELPLTAIRFDMARIDGSLSKDKLHHTHLLDKETDDLKRLIELVEESVELGNLKMTGQLDNLRRLLKNMPALHDVDAKKRVMFLTRLENEKQSLVKQLTP